MVPPESPHTLAESSVAGRPRTAAGAVGRAALASGVLNALATVLIVLFFTFGGIFGPANDIAIALAVLLLVPLARHLASDTGPLVLALGLGSLSGAGLLQAGVGLGAWSFLATLPLVIAVFGLVGLWMLLANVTARARMPRWIAATGAVAGGGYVVGVVGFVIGGMGVDAMFHPVALAGGVVAAIGAPVWAIALGLHLMRTPPSSDA